MAGQDDVYPLWWTHNLSAATVANGTMTGTARDADPHFWLQFPPIPSAMEAINLARQPIDANRYTHLSFMMWLPDSVVPGARNGRLVRHGEPAINDVGLAALALLVAESDARNKEVMIRLIENMLALPGSKEA